MIDDRTVDEIATLMALEHRLNAPEIAADVLHAVADDAEQRAEWLKINQAIWRALHRRTEAAPPQ